MFFQGDGQPSKKEKASGAKGIAMGPNRLHGFTPAAGIHLLQDPVNVVSHGIAGEMQLRSNLLVCETLGH